MWDLPRSGINPMSPALAGRFFTTVSPGKPSLYNFDGHGEKPPTRFSPLRAQGLVSKVHHWLTHASELVLISLFLWFSLTPQCPQQGSSSEFSPLCLNVSVFTGESACFQVAAMPGFSGNCVTTIQLPQIPRPGILVMHKMYLSHSHKA